MSGIIPHDTRDTTAEEAVMDLETGVGMLINHIEMACVTIGESPDAVDIMHDMQSVIWLVLRLQNDIADVWKKVCALQKPGLAGASE